MRRHVVGLIVLFLRDDRRRPGVRGPWRLRVSQTLLLPWAGLPRWVRPPAIPLRSSRSFLLRQSRSLLFRPSLLSSVRLRIPILLFSTAIRRLSAGLRRLSGRTHLWAGKLPAGRNDHRGRWASATGLCRRMPAARWDVARSIARAIEQPGSGSTWPGRSEVRLRGPCSQAAHMIRSGGGSA
jgi:hypothetical protein